ncbi:MAG TPA: radical SAM protein, partial [Candidatus Acidoferrum sp.]|nr:radical SAM protein [Candidatus Acidoferrum sp.]
MTGAAPRKPDMIGWEITSQCNLTCKHCFSAASRRAHNELTHEECLKVIDSMAAIGVGYIGWTGGEPLLRTDLEELTEYAGSKGIRCTITTNGVLLDRQRAESIVASRNRAIQISLDGSTAERNHRMRSATSDEYERILEALHICYELGTRIVLATMIGRENLEDGPEMIRMAKQLGAGSIRFCGYTPIGRGKRGEVFKRLGFSSGLMELHRFIETAQDDSDIICEFDPGFGPVPPEYSFHKCS